MKFTNTYIFGFSTIMVIVVATVLSFANLQLKDRMDRNVQIEKMKNILASVHIESTDKNAEDLFNKYITDSYVINFDANKIDTLDAFSVDMKKELEKIRKINNLVASTVKTEASPFKQWISKFIEEKNNDSTIILEKIITEKSTRLLPVYECQKNDSIFYVLPLRGKGLWGPIWGYAALNDDYNTIYGVNFDHKSETPGLGAEINQKWFQEKFDGKTIFNSNGEFVSIEVVKGGAPESAEHAVDAISGGTITSKGLESMIYSCLSSYQNFLNKTN